MGTTPHDDAVGRAAGTEPGNHENDTRPDATFKNAANNFTACKCNG